MDPTMTMTRDQSALLRAVADDPVDDVRRLVYADYLEEHDQPERAEMIRIQCERAELDAQTPGPKNPEVAAHLAALKARSQELRWKFGRKWAAEVAPGLSGGRAGHPPLFPRGFIEEVDLPASSYLRHLDRIHSRTPLRRVRLTHPVDRWQVDLRSLAANPGLATVESLSIDGPIDPGGFAALAAALHGRRLTELRVAGDTVAPEWMGWVLGGPLVTTLRRLELAGGDTARPAGRLLGTPPASPRTPARLEALCVRGLELDPGELAGLLAGGCLPDLYRLDLEFTFCWAGAEALRHLTTASAPTGLAEISLEGNAVGPAGAGWLAGAPWLTRLRYLNLSTNELGDDGVTTLAACPSLSGLLTLSLVSNQVTDRGARALAGSPHLAGMERLILTDNGIGPTGAGLLREQFGDRVSV